MVKIRVTRGGETVTLEAPAEMSQATDDQVVSYVNETLKPDPPVNRRDFQVERAVEGIMVHPAPQYG